MNSLVEVKSSLSISNDVITKIVENSIKEIDGVCSLTNVPTKNHSFAMPINGKTIMVATNCGATIITVGIVVNITHRINDVCLKVQKAIKNNVQDMSGIAVAKVNVYVKGVCSKTNQ